MGMQAKSVETASNLPLLLLFLPFLGSGFVPTESKQYVNEVGRTRRPDV